VSQETPKKGRGNARARAGDRRAPPRDQPAHELAAGRHGKLSQHRDLVQSRPQLAHRALGRLHAAQQTNGLGCEVRSEEGERPLENFPRKWCATPLRLHPPPLLRALGDGAGHTPNDLQPPPKALRRRTTHARAAPRWLTCAFAIVTGTHLHLPHHRQSHRFGCSFSTQRPAA
jgi:hypothetical protein